MGNNPPNEIVYQCKQSGKDYQRYTFCTRHIAINILTNDKVFKAGLRRKMRKAAMDRNYLASVLAGSGLS